MPFRSHSYVIERSGALQCLHQLEDRWPWLAKKKSFIYYLDLEVMHCISSLVQMSKSSLGERSGKGEALKTPALPTTRLSVHRVIYEAAREIENILI